MQTRSEFARHYAAPRSAHVSQHECLRDARRDGKMLRAASRSLRMTAMLMPAFAQNDDLRVCVYARQRDAPRCLLSPIFCAQKIDVLLRDAYLPHAHDV